LSLRRLATEAGKFPSKAVPEHVRGSIDALVVAVLLPCGENPAFADGHALCVGVKAAQQIFNGEAPGPGAQGFQTYDLSSHPRWFGLIAAGAVSMALGFEAPVHKVALTRRQAPPIWLVVTTSDPVQTSAACTCENCDQSQSRWQAPRLPPLPNPH
jgi:hypothetical protein